MTPYGAAQVELAKSGKFKFIAALSQGRGPLMPQLASTTESKALKTLTAEIGTGYFVKRETPEAIVQTMHKAIQAVIGDAEFRASMVAMGQETSALQSLEVANKAFVDETTQYRAIAKSINLQAQ